MTLLRIPPIARNYLFFLCAICVLSSAACSDQSSRRDDTGLLADAGVVADAETASDAELVLVPGAPTLLFSDLTSGPATGLGDGLGEGAIVTVWGNRLGNEQGDSRVVFVDADGNTHDAAYLYYWKAADGQLPGGPANLYAYHQLQEISFSIPEAAAAGEGQIFVEVAGERSNGLSFTVRDGEIFYVKSGGSDSEGEGSWDSPWATFGYSTSGATTKAEVDAGDIIYGVDVTEKLVAIRVKDGAPQAPIALVAYPGHYLQTRGDAYGIGQWNIDDKPEYWVFSKWDIQSIRTGIDATRGGRIVANKVTDYPNGEGCAEGSSGALAGAAKGQQGGSKFLGNHVHDWGCFETSNQQHTTYFSARNRGSEVQGFELAWNVLENNDARGGFHFYDEHDCWGYSSTVKIHHNVVINQVGPGFNVGSACDENRYISGNFDIYNNVFMETGQLGGNNAGIQAISIVGEEVTGHYRIYNNLIYGYGYEGASLSSIEAGVYVSTDNYNYGGFAGTWEFFNNIVVDTHGFPFFTGEYPHTPTAHGNNIWYDPEGALEATIPDWDTPWIDQQSDPLLADPQNGVFCPQLGSPTIDAGSDTVSSVLYSDLLGRGRPTDGDESGDAAYDVGPCEYFAQ